MECFSNSGKKGITYGIAHDITEQKEIEKDLIKAKEQAEKSEDNLRFLFENMIQGVVYHKPSGDIILANKAAASILGLSLDQLYGKTSLDPRWKSIHEDGTEYPGETHPAIITIKTKKPVRNSIMGVFIPEKNDYSWINTNSFPQFNNKNELIQVIVTFEDITAIRNAKARAEENEAILKASMENSQAGIAIAEVPSGKLKYVNKAGLLIRQKGENEIVKNVDVDKYVSSWQILHFDGTPYLPDEVPLTRAVLYGEKCSKEFIIRRDNKEDRYVWANAAPVFNKDNIQTAAVVVFLDITEQKEAELIRLQNNHRLEILLNLSRMSELENDKLFNLALEKAIELCESKIGFLGFLNQDESVVKIYAWSASTMKICEIKNKYIDFKISETGIWGEVIRQRKPLIINDFAKENPLKRGTPEDHVEIVNYLSIPIFQKEKIVAVLALGNKRGDYNETDIKELTLLMDGVWSIVKQKNYEKELITAKKIAKESEQNYKLIFNSTETSNSIFNRKYVLINQNQNSINALGKNGIGLTIFELFGEKAGSLIKERMERVFSTAVSEVFETEFNLPNGKNWFRSTYQPMIHEDNTIAIQLISQNITDIKKSEAELIAAKEKAEEANRLKTEFLNNMSHEVRTPMNGIIGFSQMLDKPNLTDEKRKNYSKIVQNNSHQLLRIIDDKLAISTLEAKQEKLNETAFCLNDLLMELFSIFNLQSKGRNIPLYLNKALQNQQSYIVSDKTKLNKILSNLLENALKFTNEGFIEFGYYLENSNLILYVKDTGVGVSPKNHKIIFERFSQEEKDMSRKYGGLGLGLSISKENAQLLGGDLTLESEKGKGSTFYVTIPYKPVQKVDNNTSKSIDSKQKINKKYTILVAEDEEVNYLFIEVLFEDEIEGDYNLIHAKNGKETVEICTENNNIDLVLMDIKMPIMNGHEATEKIKEKFPNLPIIAQTAYSTESDKQLALKHGCDEFVSKPIDKEKLFGLSILSIKGCKVNASNCNKITSIS